MILHGMNTVLELLPLTGYRLKTDLQSYISVLLEAVDLLLRRLHPQENIDRNSPSPNRRRSFDWIETKSYPRTNIKWV